MKIGIDYSKKDDAFKAGQKIVRSALKKADIQQPDLVLAFCTKDLDHEQFLKGIQSVCAPDTPIVGGTTIGVINNDVISYNKYKYNY